MKRLAIALIALTAGIYMVSATNQRQKILFDEDWAFAYGDASSPEKDFGCGTEYFNYLTKANSIHNEGPYSPKFDATKWGKEWKTVNLPHDWVVDLPFAKEASHSHGYKTVGYKYPETSVGWYRKTFGIPEEDMGKHITVQFDGIFRDAEIWCNGFYLGKESDGYTAQVYDITDYLNYGGDNLLTVRADATLEEGWFYEGAGIYRHVWLNKTSPVSVDPYGTFVQTTFNSPDLSEANLTILTTVTNNGRDNAEYGLHHMLLDANGEEVVCSGPPTKAVSLRPREKNTDTATITLSDPTLWDTENPYRYTLRTEVIQNGEVVDVYDTRIGIRDVKFDADLGFLLNGKQVKLRGANMHQDHAGVGSGIPDALQAYRMQTLKDWGFNAVRASHNPSAEALLEVCDSLGILLLEENRLSGTNEAQLRVVEKMVERGRNHPCIILWSVGNEEWGLEWNKFGTPVSQTMRDYMHLLDPTREMTFATSGGPTVLVPADVAGYNYVMQNPIDKYREEYPGRKGIGTEETTGCGTRGVYATDSVRGVMEALNRRIDTRDNSYNQIERGWKFYDERPWLGGLFYWTGFDYRGEPNPMVYPSTGSEFGIFDYCGFPKDEAYYLKSWWTDQPVLHILPHWNLSGRESEEIDIWVYSNCDEVALNVNGKNLGRKKMEKNGHLSWPAVYQPGYVKATGYKNGKKVMEKRIETTGEAAKMTLTADRNVIKADNRDVSVMKVELADKKGRFVPTACNKLHIKVEGPARILGAGNGDPAFKAKERPDTRDGQEFEIDAFNGLAQILIQSTGNPGSATVTVSSPNLPTQSYTIEIK